MAHFQAKRCAEWKAAIATANIELAAFGGICRPRMLATSAAFAKEGWMCEPEICVDLKKFMSDAIFSDLGIAIPRTKTKSRPHTLFPKCGWMWIVLLVLKSEPHLSPLTTYPPPVEFCESPPYSLSALVYYAADLRHYGSRVLFRLNRIFEKYA